MAGVPAEPAAEGGADDAYAGGGGVPGGEPCVPRALDDVAPEDAGADPRDASLGVDPAAQSWRRSAARRRRRVGRRAAAPRGPCPAARPSTRRGGRLHHVGDLGRERRVDNRCRPGVDLEVPGHACLVVERGHQAACTAPPHSPRRRSTRAAGGGTEVARPRDFLTIGVVQEWHSRLANNLSPEARPGSAVMAAHPRRSRARPARSGGQEQPLRHLVDLQAGRGQVDDPALRP